MKRAILSLLLLAAVGCGDDRAEVAGAPTLAGGWNYTLQLDDATTVHGAMTLGQDGAQVVGVMDLPIDGPADAATWRWNIAGTVDGNAAQLRASVNDGCECPDVAPIDLACVVTSGLLDCGFLTAVYAGP